MQQEHSAPTCKGKEVMNRVAITRSVKIFFFFNRFMS